MKTLILASTLLAAVAAATVPASAQYAGFTGDGIFGHDYRPQAAARSAAQGVGDRGAKADLSVGYTEEAAPRNTGSVQAVTAESRAKTAAAPESDTVPPRGGSLPR